MAKHHVDFTLLSIDLNDTYISKQVSENEVINLNDFNWHFSYNFEFMDYTDDHEKVSIQFSFELAREADDAVMCIIDITNTFKVTIGMSNEIKPEILKVFFDTSINNIQGIFAALTERSPLAALLINDINSEKYISELKQIAQDDWYRI